MKEKELERIRQKHQEIKDVIDSEFSEIGYLEQNDPSVIRYRELLQLKNDANCGKFDTPNKICEYCVASIGPIEQTNEIYVYLYRIGEKILYRNLEDADDIKYIGIEDKEEFEKSHKILYAGTLERYYGLRNNFFKLCISDGQEQAIKLILSNK